MDSSATDATKLISAINNGCPIISYSGLTTVKVPLNENCMWGGCYYIFSLSPYFGGFEITKYFDHSKKEKFYCTWDSNKITFSNDLETNDINIMAIRRVLSVISGQMGEYVRLGTLFWHFDMEHHYKKLNSGK